MTEHNHHLPLRERAAGAAVAVLCISNLVTNRWLPSAAYVPWNLALAGGLVALARRSGCDITELGADLRHLRPSLRLGAAGAGMVAVVYGLLPFTRAGDMFRDDRVTSAGASTACRDLLIRIPLGTVLAEEVAFRGVLPALLTSSRRPPWVPGAVASLLFGLWHILPAREMGRANEGVGRIVGNRTGALAVVPVVGFMTLAGGVLHSLRQRSGHLAAPVAVHLATNVLGYVGARLSKPQ